MARLKKLITWWASSRLFHFFCSIPYSKCAGQGLTCVKKKIMGSTSTPARIHLFPPAACMHACWQWVTRVHHSGSPFESCRRNFETTSMWHSNPPNLYSTEGYNFHRADFNQNPDEKSNLCRNISYLFLANGWKQIPSRSLVHASHFLGVMNGSTLRSGGWDQGRVQVPFLMSPVWFGYRLWRQAAPETKAAWRGIKRYNLLNFWQPVAASHVFQ